MALLEATKTPAFYVGAMGSLRTTRARVERLASLGCATEELNKLHAPIGFDIGSKKPAEIAISILAEVLAERHRFVAAK
jgi:xanthine dehydrogenase accessory factor